VPYAVLAATCDTAYYIPLYTIGSAFETCISIAVYSLVADLAPTHQRAQVIGQMFFASLLPLMVLSPLGGYLSEHYSENDARFIFLIAAVTSLLPLVYAVLFVHEAPRVAPIQDVIFEDVLVRHGNEAGSEGEGPQGAKIHVDMNRKSSNARAGSWVRLCVLLAVAFFYNMSSMGEQSLIFLFISNQFPVCKGNCMAALFATFSFVACFSQLLYLPLTMRFLGTLWTLRVAILSAGCAVFVYAIATELWMVFAQFAVAVPAFCSLAVMNQLVSEAAPAGMIGRAQGLLEASRTTAKILAPPLFATLLTRAAHTPTPGIPWLLGSVFFSIAFVLTFFLSCSCAATPTVQDMDEPLLRGNDMGDTDSEGPSRS